MKRRFRHTVLWLLLIALTMLAGNQLVQRFRHQHEGLRQDLPSSARARPVLVFDQSEWTAFRLPSNARRLKILSRANFVGHTETLLDLEFSYQLDYQLETIGGDVLAEGNFALQTKISPAIDPNGQPAAAVFYGSSPLIPSIAKASILELPADRITILKLRTAALTSPIRDISARLFVRQELPERKLAYLWERLSETSRRNLATARIHDLIDLTPTEQRSILSNRWAPIGAQGVSGHDYQERTLYLRNDLLPAKQVLVEPLGLGEIRCGLDHRSVLGIPTSGGLLRLEFRSLEKASTSAPTIIVRHFGETLQERSTDEISVTGQMTEFARKFASGMIEIESPISLAITPFFTEPGGSEQLLERESILSRSWQSGPDQAIDFALGGDRTQERLFRLSIRPLQSTATTVETVYLDKDGQVILGSKKVLSEIVPSLFDRLITPEGEMPVNDPLEVISELPVGVHTVRILSNAPMLVSGYTRPSILLHRTRVPADYVRAFPDPQRQPIWFSLRPLGADDLIRAHRSALIHVQTRPPEDDVDILAGRYQWEDYQPESGAFGQYLLNDRDPASPTRKEALPSLYMPLSVGRSQTIPLAQVPGLDLPSRHLAFFRANDTRTRLRIYVDGNLLLDRELVNERGELFLPPILPTSRQIRVECTAAGFQCFLNYVSPSEATKIKRLAQRVAAGDSLAFLVEKVSGDDELLTGMFFAPPDSTDEMEIEVTLEQASEGGFLPQAEAFTPRHRLYVLAPEAEGMTPVLGGKMPYVDGGQRFFIPLGPDLLPGTYKITAHLRRGSEGYLTMSKVTGGDYADARFFREVSR